MPRRRGTRRGVGISRLFKLIIILSLSTLLIRMTRLFTVKASNNFIRGLALTLPILGRILNLSPRFLKLGFTPAISSYVPFLIAVVTCDYAPWRHGKYISTMGFEMLRLTFLILLL